MHKSKVSNIVGELTETGRGAATVFRGFCGKHDKIFLPIDNNDYSIGDSYQEYLFALRAAAHEFSMKSAANQAIKDAAYKTKLIPDASLGMVEVFLEGHEAGISDQRITRGTFNNTLSKQKFAVIETAVITVNEELPMAVNSSFNIELDDKGKIINDHRQTEEALSKRMKPCFLNIFPQKGKTYCLISYWHKDRRDYAFLQNLNDKSDIEKQVLISNLIATYTENFVANPTFWKSLTKKRQLQYLENFASTFKSPFSLFIQDKEFNLFPSAQPY